MSQRLRIAITGGAQGIGRAIAEALLKQGHDVVLGDIDEAKAKAVAATLGATAFGLDVTSQESFEAFWRQASDAGPIDVLVNNAGIMPIGAFLEESPSVTARAFAINVDGMMTGTRIAGLEFHRRGSGHIVNLASAMGVVSSPNAATYCATKHAIVGFTESLRQEWRGSGVQISAICPGFVRTELIAGMQAPGALERFVVVDPEDVAQAVVRTLKRGKSRTVYVPRAVAPTRVAASLPAAMRDAAFRAAGGDQVTSNMDLAARAAYQERMEQK